MATAFQFPRMRSFATVLCYVFPSVSQGFTGSRYRLDTEHSGRNFFDGWDYYTGEDPTNGYVIYYSRTAANATGLISSPSDSQAVYVGVDHTLVLPVRGAGRPSVRISSQRSWTHGLFIGDFENIPAGACGSWPAFWTLGSGWPNHGEIDILEGVNDMKTNVVSLHTNAACSISANKEFQTGVQGGMDCTYYPGDNSGCNVIDSNTDSFGNFNHIGGGVYAMQWTSEYIRIWFWPRQAVPQDITKMQPNPSSWGIPVANMQGSCVIDDHFQQHNIILDTKFCGDYAGRVWDNSSCQSHTAAQKCVDYVASNPKSFADTFWNINSIRVYQLINPTESKPLSPAYIASLQLPSVLSTSFPSPVRSLEVEQCSETNVSIVKFNDDVFEHLCGHKLDGDWLGPPITPDGTSYEASSFRECVDGCNYWNLNGTAPVHGTCVGISFDTIARSCHYYAKVTRVTGTSDGYQSARLIYYGYPEAIYNLDSNVSELPTNFVEIIPEPQACSPPTDLTVTTNSTALTQPPYNYTSVDTQSVPPALGKPTTTTGMLLNQIVSSSLSSATIAGFVYAGCKFLPSSVQRTAAQKYSPEMDVDSCVTSCGAWLTAAIFGEYCFCTNNAATDAASVDFPDYECNIPCPGDERQICGGYIGRIDGSLAQKRQLLELGANVLVNLYRNAALLTTRSQAPSPSTSNVTITRTSTVRIYEISTKYLDYCDTCPGYVTEFQTTITIPNCGCTARKNDAGIWTRIPHISIPMTTVTSSCACGKYGASSTIVLTIPWATGIRALFASLQDESQQVDQSASATSDISVRPKSHAAKVLDDYMSLATSSAISLQLIPKVGNSSVLQHKASISSQLSALPTQVLLRYTSGTGSARTQIICVGTLIGLILFLIAFGWAAAGM